MPVLQRNTSVSQEGQSPSLISRPCSSMTSYKASSSDPASVCPLDLFVALLSGKDCTHVGVSIPSPIRIPPTSLLLSAQGKLRVQVVARLGMKICAEVRVQVLWAALRPVLWQDPPLEPYCIFHFPFKRERAAGDKHHTSHAELWFHFFLD